VGVGDAYPNSFNIGTHSGDYNALITHNQVSDETFLVTPPLNFDAYESVELSFWYMNRSQTYSINVFDYLSVYYRIGEEGEWNELWSTGFNRHEQWTYQTLTLTDLADNYQIGFMMEDNNGWGVGLDDILITHLAAPAGEPMTLTVEEGTTATLTGLAANTAYEVRVKSNCDAAEYSQPVVFTTPDTSVHTQTIALVAGWNWVSFYIDMEDNNGLNQLETCLGTCGLQIITPGGSLIYRGGRWIGGITYLSNTKGYKILTNAPVTVTITGGQVVNPAECEIPIANGWNWIAYPLAESKTVTEVLVGFQPSNGDNIKTQGGSAIYRNGHWIPGTFTFEPGKSYTYKSTATEQKTLIFQTGSKAK